MVYHISENQRGVSGSFDSDTLILFEIILLPFIVMNTVTLFMSYIFEM